MESLTYISMERKHELLADATNDKLAENEKSSNNRSGTTTFGKQDGGQTRSLTVAPASSQDVSLLTTAILELTKHIQSSSPLVEDSKQNKGKQTASSAPNAAPAKKGRQVALTTKVANTTQNISSTAQEELGESSGENFMRTTGKTDCQGLYNAVLNDESDCENATENGQEGNTSESEDEALAEFVKEYETDDAIGKGLNNGQLAKLVNKMFHSQ